jgi:hypothetical protein
MPNCRFNDGEAIVRVELSKGCIVYPKDQTQNLCFHHLMRSTPLGELNIINDYTDQQIFNLKQL